MDYVALKAELAAGHPVTGTYSLDSTVAAVQLNEVNRTKNRASVSGDEMFSATDSVEFAGLSAENRLLWVSFCGRSRIDPFSEANVGFVVWIFGNNDTTAALNVLRRRDVSRAEELGFRRTTPGAVEYARTL